MKSYTFSLIFVLLSTHVFSQFELKLRQVNGISISDNIYDLQINDKNQLWIAGKTGVSLMEKDKEPQVKFNQSNISSLIQVGNGIIYTTLDNSIYYNNEKIDQLTESGIQITDIEVYNRQIWVGTNQGIYLYNEDTKAFFKKLNDRNSDLKSNQINVLYADNSDILYVGTDRGVFRIKNDDWGKCQEQSSKMIAITEYYNIVWLLSDDEMWEIESTTRVGRWYNAALKRGLFEGKINDIIIDNEGILYVASDVLVRFNPATNEIKKFDNSLGLVSKKCLSLACDRNNQLYVGTEGAGLFKLAMEEEKVDEMSLLALLEEPIQCQGDMNGSIYLELTGGKAPYSYTWSPANLKGTNPKGLKKGTYSVTVEDSFGNQVSRSVTIEEPAPITTKIVSQERISGKGEKDGFCQLEVLGGTAPYNIVWDNKEKGIVAKKLNYGLHNYKITDANGCEAEGYVTIEKEKFLPELDINSIAIGQTLKIDELYFEADSSYFKPESEQVLDEIFDFMAENKSVVIEIGGHTNNIPPPDYCDKLSTARAKNVAQYISDKGIDSARIRYKGYGKRNPIASNKTYTGRSKNQRVEIKILELVSN